jgi:outer membrane protein assembly factor BamB
MPQATLSAWTSRLSKTSNDWDIAVLTENLRRVTLCHLFFVLLAACLSAQVFAAADWPQWQGPNRDAKSVETGLLKQWPKDGPQLLWKAERLGDGYSTVSIADGLIYTTGTIAQGKDKKEFVFALDLDGNLKWKQTFGSPWPKNYDPSRSTPTVDSDRLYVVSGSGEIACLDSKTGEQKWYINAFEKFEGKFHRYGIAESPLIVDNKVIVTPGGKKAAMVALDKMTGQTVWTSAAFEETASYTSPLLVEHNSHKLIVTCLECSIIALDAETGSLLWHYSLEERYAQLDRKPGGSNTGVHPNTPIYHAGSIYVTIGYQVGGVKLNLSEDGSKYSVAWTDPQLDCQHGGVILHDGFVYGSTHDGKWACIDFETGKLQYKVDGIGKGSVFYADGMLYCHAEQDGTVALVEASPKAYNVVSSFTTIEGKGQHWAHPVICDGKLYIRYRDTLKVYNVKVKD